MSAKTRKEQLEALLAEEPNDPCLRYGLAMEYVSQGDDAQAVRCFEELLRASPDYVPAYLQAGQALARIGRAEDGRVPRLPQTPGSERCPGGDHRRSRPLAQAGRCRRLRRRQGHLLREADVAYRCRGCGDG